MLIDNNEIDLSIYRRILKRSGLVESVVSFSSARKALTYLVSHPKAELDLILLDTHLPGMTGLEFLTAVHSRFRPSFDVPIVIMLTVPLNEEDQWHVDKFDFVKGFVTKPLDVNDLRTTCNILENLQAA